MKAYRKLIIFGGIELFYFILIGRKDLEFSFILWTILSVSMAGLYFNHGKKVSLGDGGLVGRTTSQSSTYADRMYGKKMGESVSSYEKNSKEVRKTIKSKLSLYEYILYGFCIFNGIGFIIVKFL